MRSIDLSRSRSKSPSRMFRPTTPRNIPRNIEIKNIEPTRNAMFETVHKEKILTPFGLVEPKTPPGPPPVLSYKKSIKRLVVKKQNK